MSQIKQIITLQQRVRYLLIYTILFVTVYLVSSYIIPSVLIAQEDHDIYYYSEPNWLIMAYTEYYPTGDGDYSVYLKVTDKSGTVIPAADIMGLTNNPELVATDAMSPNLGLCFDGGTDRTAYIMYSTASGMTLLSVTEIRPVCSPLLSMTTLGTSFGPVNVGNTVTSSVSLCNNGDCDLTIYTISQPDSPFSISSNTCGSTVAFGNCCTVTVQFAPTRPGTYESSISIETNGGNSEVSMRGIGQ